MLARLATLMILFLCLIPHALAGTPSEDSTTQVYRFNLKDGSVIMGTITSSTTDSLYIRTGNGIAIAFPQSVIKSRERVRGTFANGEYIRVDPNNTRLLFGPTARPIRGGTGYFAAYEIFFTYLSVGITDFLSLGGGLTLFPGASGQLYYLAPKLAFSSNDESFSVGAGALYMNTTWGNADGLGIVYGMGTYGSPRAAITGGFGYGYAGGEFADSPVILIGGELQASNSFKVISENWFPVDSDVAILSFGFRFFGDNLAADLGFFYPLRKGSGISGGFPFIPWLGFAYNFGK